VASVDDVAIALAAHKSGDSVEIKVQRQSGDTATVEVTLRDLPAAG
jgi:S1-C subfamily serine protease